MVGRFLTSQRNFLIGMTLWASFLLVASPSISGQQVNPGRNANSVLFQGGQQMLGPTPNLTELYNGTNPQAFRVYNTYTSATNYEAIRMYWSGNIGIIETGAGSGGGTGRQLIVGTGSGNGVLSFQTNNGNRWTVGAAADNYALYPNSDNSVDLCLSAGNRCRTAYFGTSMVVGTSIISATAPTVSSGFGSSPSISGTAASFTVNVGTGGTASSGVLAMPTATNGWGCTVTNQTAVAANRANQWTVQTASSQTSVTVQNQTISTGAALAWTASDVLSLVCIAR